MSIRHDSMTKLQILRKNFPRLSCSQCILQWTYTAGNNWGVCSNGTGELGCGPQETFRGCADIRIVDSDSAPLDNNNNQKMQNSNSIGNRICTAVAPYDNIEEVNQWCQENCPTGNRLSCLDIASLPHKMITSCIQII